MALVLVVDDDPINRQLITTLLRHGRHEALEAQDGVQALAMVRDACPDLVICDILMPNMDGYEFVRRLRGEAEVAHTEVVFYTATFLEKEARQLALACGVTQVLTKPCEPEEVLRAIALALASVNAKTVAPALASAPAEFDREHLRVMTDKLLAKAQELELANQRLSALTELNLHLASERDPHTLLDKLCRGARDLLGARCALLCARDKSNSPDIHRSSWGLDDGEHALLQALPFDGGLLTEVMADRSPRRFVNPSGQPTDVGLSAAFPPMHAGLIAPVASLREVHGWILLVDKLGRPDFSADDATLLATHAAQAGRIYENGSLYAKLQRHMAALQTEVRQRQESEHRLTQSKARLRALVDSAMDAIVGIDESLRIVLFNPAATEMFGYSAEEVMGEPLDRLMPARFRSDHEALVRGFGLSDTQHRQMGGLRTVAGQRRDGQEFPIEVTVSKVASEGMRYTAILRDVTERARADERIRRLARVATVLGDINSLIVRMRTRDELFREACRIAVDVGEFTKAWIGEVSDPAKLQVTMVAWSGSDGGYFEQLSAEMSSMKQYARDAFGAVIQHGEPAILNDLTQVPTLGLMQRALAAGSRSLAWLPLTVADQPVAVLVLHSNVVGFFDEDELKLLKELAGDMSFALQHLAQAERLVHLAYYDSLTGLANATLFHERLEQFLGAASSGHAKLALALVDLARFKMLNDSLGRHAGDQLLKLVAERLIHCTGDRTQIARITADRFAIVFPEVKAESDLARLFSQQYQQCFGQVFVIEGHELRLTAKVGVAVHPHDGSDAETLFRNAEAALKKAKASTETLLFYNAGMTSSVAETLALEGQLRRALEHEEFVLHYQPKVSVDTGEIVAVEALIRWQSPDKGLVPPLKFIPLLEETGMIVAVGDWALRRAAADHRHWRSLGLQAPRIAVNVSAIQLRGAHFVASVAAALGCGERGDGSHGIDIELTESVVMQDVDNSIGKLHALRAMGVQIGIDDFGTGYSSLAYLSRLPAQLLKIDRAFIATMLSDPNNMTLVSTMISMAHSLRLHVVAEGVETEEQAKILRLLRCDQMQGYLISRPVSQDQLITRLKPL